MNSVLTKTLRTENKKVVARDASDRRQADRIFIRERIRGNLQRLKYCEDSTIPSGVRANRSLYTSLVESKDFDEFQLVISGLSITGLMTVSQFENFLSTFGNHDQRLIDYMRRYWQNTVYEDLTQHEFSDEKIQEILDITGHRLQRPQLSTAIKKAKTSFKNFFNK